MERCCACRDTPTALVSVDGYEPDRPHCEPCAWGLVSVGEDMGRKATIRPMPGSALGAKPPPPPPVVRHEPVKSKLVPRRVEETPAPIVGLDSVENLLGL